MMVYYVSEIVCHGDLKSPRKSRRVSDYFEKEEDAEKYRKEHFPENTWGSLCWNTTRVIGTFLERNLIGAHMVK